MRPSASEPRGRGRKLAVVVVVVASSSACTLQAGLPWGEADVGLQAQLALDDDRLDEDGAGVTSTDWAFDLRSLSLSPVEARLLLQGDGGTATTTFDPANPPAGYSLCHGGHCHADDGRLVDYADIAAEISGSASTGGDALTLAATDDAVDVADGVVDVALGPCTPDCTLPPGALSRLEVALAGVRLQGSVHDRRTGDRARLQGEHAVDLVVDADVVIGVEVAGAIGRDEPVGVGVDAVLSIAPGLLDGVDFAAVVAGDDDDASATVAEHLLQSTLTASVERFEPDAPGWVLAPEGGTP